MKAKKQHGILWKYLIVAVCLVVILVTIITAVLYRNATDMIRNEYCKLNQSAVSKAAFDFQTALDRADRLAVGIGVTEDCKIFWGSSNPEEVWRNFYRKLGTVLSSYCYATSDYINSVMLYSTRYQRFMKNALENPYYLNGTESDIASNAGWVWELEEWDEIWSKRKLLLRDANGGFPKVLTIIRLFNDSEYGGAVAVDVKLDELFQEIRRNQTSDTDIWILDQEGQLVELNNVSQKNQSVDWERMSQCFDGTADELSLLTTIDGDSVAYAQQYVEKYGFYLVAVMRLDDLNQQIAIELCKAILLGAVCIVIGCAMIILYTRIARKPLDRIQEMIRNPSNISEVQEYPDEMVRETADYIVRSIQTNAELEKELEKRVRSLRKSQLQTLKAQINPHFMFNTLNMIVMLIDEETKDSRAAQIAKEFAK